MGLIDKRDVTIALKKIKKMDHISYFNNIFNNSVKSYCCL